MRTIGHRTRDRIIAKLAKLASVTHRAELEITPIAGTFSYGTDEEDHAAEREVMERARRTVWGWCVVSTTVEYQGFTATVYLGGCSYESADEFIDSEGRTQTLESCAALLDRMEHAMQTGLRAVDLLNNLRAR